MRAYIHRIETLVPPHAYSQAYARDCMMDWLPGKRTRRLIRGIYNRSGIETRYSVLPDFAPGGVPRLFTRDADGRVNEPSTGPRNACYGEWAGPLAVQAARNAVDRASGFDTADITHVITVSCTGFCNPGMDLDIVRGLGLSDGVERYHVGFMGCYAAFPALRMARQFCQAQPQAVVLVVCLELCTLHLQLRETADSLLANALFADGAAAAIISARRPAPGTAALALHTFFSALAPEGSTDMAWSIGDHGFDIRLSTYVPDIIAANIEGIVDRLMAPSPWTQEHVRTWAVHPGGRAILDKVQAALGLGAAQVDDARTVLRDYGNMSSATILFVLARILDGAADDDPHPLCAMAFGPGLTIDGALMERVTTPRSVRATHLKREVEYVAL